MAHSASAGAILALGLAFAWTAVLGRAVPPALRRLRLTRRNFRGDDVVTAGGLILVLGALPSLLYQWTATARSSFVLALAVCMGGFGLLGLQDDLFGSGQARGIRGHLRALLKERRVTSGLIKAVGGLGLATWIALGMYHLTGLAAVTMTLTVALGANAGNLLDLRPGRAGAVGIVCLVVACIALLASGNRPAALAVASLIIAEAVVQQQDARGWLMLGDTGSNPLGACCAVALYDAFPSVGGRLALLAALAALHVIAERYSLTAIIEGNRLLRSLDRLTGER